MSIFKRFKDAVSEILRFKCYICKCTIENNNYVIVPKTDDLCFNPFPVEISSGDYICPNCYQKYVQDIHNKYNQALEFYNEVHTYPSSYQGKIHVKNDYKELDSDFYHNKEMALRQLKITAMFLGFDTIYDITYDYELETDDNYTYKIWCASGKAATKYM